MPALNTFSHHESQSSFWEKIKSQSKALVIFLLLNGVVGAGFTNCEKKEFNKTREKKEWFSPSSLQKDTLSSEIIIIRDAGMCFYIVQEDDTLEKIWKKLQTLEEFSYLKAKRYQPRGEKRNIRGFNIPGNQLKPGLEVPIPKDKEQMQIPLEQFSTYSLEAIDWLKSDPTYGFYVKLLLAKIGNKELVNVMCAFAKSESAQKTILGGRDEIWSLEFHRWEPKYHCFSFSPYHILMEKNADGESPWPWLRAKKKLGFTNGKIYHPKYAGALFLAYWIEKTNFSSEKLVQYLNINSLKDAEQTGKIYNGSSKYWEKLWANLQYVRKTLK